MRIYYLLSVLLFICCTGSKNISSAKKWSGDIVIENVNIIDVKNNMLHQSQNVHIRDKGIANILKHNKIDRKHKLSLLVRESI